MHKHIFAQVLRSMALAGALIGGLLSGAATAAVNSLDISPDITVALDALTVADEDAVMDAMAPANLGALPASVDLIAFHRAENGDRLAAFDTTAMLPGGLIYRPGDVVRFDGAVYSLELDGQANGVPAGARVDALTTDGSGNLLLSFDVTVEIDGVVFADEDLARFDGADFTVFFDASAAGINTALDLDAAHFDAVADTILMSFDGAGMVAGATFADEDLVAFEQGGATWSVEFDGSASHAAWVASDLDAAFVVFITDILFIDGFE